jgi:hypothetical protein
MMRSPALLAAAVVALAPGATAQSRSEVSNADTVRAYYQKREFQIPMRDGVRLFTAVYLPRDASRTWPILMTRTPYSVAPYGPEAYRAMLAGTRSIQDEGFIFVFQDVRGRHLSEGAFTHMTPHRAAKRGPADVDESTDTRDTIDWLLKNLPGHNGKVGIYGTSYPGFYTAASCIDAHPALVACSPQAPMTDIATGDDAMHNGALKLAHWFGFHLGFGRAPRNAPGPDPAYPRPWDVGTDGYAFFLRMGPLANADRDYFKGTAPLWTEQLEHPNYDEFWKARNLAPHLKKMAPAILTVGGWYDAEDLFGPLATYRAIEQQNTGVNNRLVMGPWSHGQWNRGDADRMGHAFFDQKTGVFYRDSILLPFFRHYLKGAPDPDVAKVTTFVTGANRWRRSAVWPPSEATPRALYLHPGGKLGFDRPPAGAADADQYWSDPARPVPFIDWIAPGMPQPYLTADQRFASRRTDVLTWQTDVLTEDVTLTGPLTPVLHVATTGTDADFVVKLIDVFPDSMPPNPQDPGFVTSGYQQLVRGEPFRGRFRRSFEQPVAFVPDRADSIRYVMPDVDHTFRKGHRIMIQVQSSWFPLFDRNPQTFVPNIFFAKESDFRPAMMRVFRSPARPSRLEVLVLPAGP